MPPKKKKRAAVVTATAAAANVAVAPWRLPMLPRRLLSSRTLGLMGKPLPGQLVFLHCPGLRHFEQPTLRLHPPCSRRRCNLLHKGRSGSVLSFLTTTPSIRRTTNTATTPSSIRKNELLTPSSITAEGEEEGRQLICVVKKGKRFVCQPFPLCGSVRILITRM